MTIESVVRPFESRGVTPPDIAPTATITQLEPNVRLQIGRVGATRTFHGSYSLTVTVYNIRTPNETTIANPNAP